MTNQITNEQMELGLGQPRARLPMNVSSRRSSRARWWFSRMREAVDRAFEWQPAQTPRPEQIWFSAVQRRVLNVVDAGAATSTERQICE
jgi:hypothetical protein